MKKITQIIPEYTQIVGSTGRELTGEWAYILDTETLEVTKVKVKTPSHEADGK